MKLFISLLLLGAFCVSVIGCEAKAKVDDNGAAVKVKGTD